MALKIIAFMLHSKIWQTMTDLLCQQPDECHEFQTLSEPHICFPSTVVDFVWGPFSVPKHLDCPTIFPIVHTVVILILASY